MGTIVKKTLNNSQESTIMGDGVYVYLFIHGL
jgi:hypothetical protein